MLWRHLEIPGDNTDRLTGTPPAPQLILTSSSHPVFPPPNLHADMIIHVVMQ